jgi:Protein of unknown function (DUF5818)
MKKLSLTICLAITFFVTAAVAQMAPSGGQGSQGSSPSMGQPSRQQPGQPGMTQPDNSTGMGQNPDQNNPNQKTEKGEKKLKGCVQSSGGQFVLETKKGKAVALTGQDVSAHVGHEVSVKGTWESGAAGAGTSSSSASSGNAGTEKTFNVASVDMISESCGGKSSKSETKGGYGSSSTGSTPSSNPSGTGTSNPPSSTAPPQ